MTRRSCIQFRRHSSPIRAAPRLPKPPPSCPDVHDAARNLLVRASLQHLWRDHPRRAGRRTRRRASLLHHLRRDRTRTADQCGQCRQRRICPHRKLDPSTDTSALRQPPAFNRLSPWPQTSVLRCASVHNVCVQSHVLLTDPADRRTGVCGISVTFQYPFQFWLPFTSLNKQRIWLTASARVRMETQ